MTDSLKDKKFVDPPVIFTRQKMQEWLGEEITKSRPNLPLELVDTEEWADYVNHHHFVPGTIEGLPENFEFDYNWSPEKPHRALPSAELTEKGRLMVWWQRCNYHELNEKQCQDYIHMVVAHEGRHFDQWQRIAVNALTFLGYDVAPKNLPDSIEDIDAFKGAREAFMRVWADGAHYQCREVEVYASQITSGETSEKTDTLFKQHLQGVYIYVHGSDYSPGCANSKWAPEFSPFIKIADELFKKHNIGPAQREKL